MSKKYDSSDPLPYTQVDRAVKVTAMLLAQKLGVTFQHAMGSLVEFWQLNGDPRDLERLLREGKREVVLSEQDVVGRFELASGGKQADPNMLANLGLLEPKENGEYRVRGMSRYFDPIERRIQAREAAAKGGRASAVARKERFGTSQPRSESASGSAQATAQADSKRARSDSRSAPEATAEATPKRDRSGAEPADSGQRTSLHSYSLTGVAPPLIDIPAEKPAKSSAAQEFAGWVDDRRIAVLGPTTARMDGLKRHQWALLTELLKDHGRKTAEAAWHVFERDAYALKEGLPVALFASQWGSIVSRLKPGDTQPSARCSVAGCEFVARFDGLCDAHYHEASNPYRSEVP